MAHCPICQNEVQASFGMILCSKCQTPLFFDFDGNPQMGDSVSDPPSAEVESVQKLEENFLEIQPDLKNIEIDNQYPNNERSLSGPELSGASQSSENSNNYNYNNGQIFSNQSDADPVVFQEIQQDSSEIDREPTAFGNVSNENDQAVQGQKFNVDSILEDSESEDLEFNSELNENSSSTNSQFFYDIEIDGIDGSKLRNELYDELKDPRWGWVAIELMGAIKSGRLILKDVNAIKASLLVNRLKALPVQVKWKQNG